MQGMRLIHEPDYFQFFILDSSVELERLKNIDSIFFKKNRISSVNGIVVVGVRSEFSPITITVEYSDKKPSNLLSGEWDRIVECSLETKSNEIVFVGCVDDPVTENFGSIPVASGNYRLRVYYGGQDKVHPDGSTEDFYAVEIWPSDEKDIKIIKSNEAS